MEHQEIAAMIVSALPCPVLPMVGGRCGDADDETVFSSHELFRQILVHLSYHSPPEARELHMSKMHYAEQLLFKELDGLDTPLCPEQVYAVYCSFMRAVLTSSPFVSKDVRFAPLGHVVRRDKVHASACDHAKSQDVLYDARGAIQRDYAAAEYPVILMSYAYRALAARTHELKQ